MCVWICISSVPRKRAQLSSTARAERQTEGCPAFLPIDRLFLSQPLYSQDAVCFQGFSLHLLTGTEAPGAGCCAAPPSSTARNDPCGSHILHLCCCCCCCCLLLRVSATWSHGEVIDRNSLPGRKGRRGKVNVKKSIEKGRHTHIYSLPELICVAAPRGEVSASSPAAAYFSCSFFHVFQTC